MGGITSRPLDIESINQDDLIIIVVGPAGAGKSIFINTAAGMNAINPGIDDIQLAICPIPAGLGDQRVVFVNTLPFGSGGEEDIARWKLSNWLKDVSSRRLRVFGILYLDSLADVWLVDSLTQYLEILRNIFQESCQEFPGRVLLATTQWKSFRRTIAAKREQDLIRHLAMLPQMTALSRICQFEDTFESAWSVVYSLLKDSDDPGSTVSVTSSRRTSVDQSSEDQTQLGEIFYDRSRALISKISGHAKQRALIADLRGEDAQHMIDFFNRILHEKDIFATNEGRSILSLLCLLVKSAQVFPRCYELQGIQSNFEPVAGGGFADICRAEYCNQPLCLKIVRLYQVKDSTQLLKAHVKELTLWAHLSHPNILPFYGVFIHVSGTTRRVCLVSPWMNNGNVRDYLANFPESPRTTLVSDIIDGLLYLHERNIVHGDLKAQNVLVSDDGHALIADFGLSRVAMTTKMTLTQSPNGTTRWKAPELFESNEDEDDNASPTRKSDIWSFSCVCYEIFTCKVPFYQYSQDYRVMAVLLKGEEIPLRPAPEDEGGNIDDRMWDLMKACWNYDPLKRPTCKEIRCSITELGFPGNHEQVSGPPEDNSAFWEAMRSKSDIKVDYERVHSILLQGNPDLEESGPAPACHGSGETSQD